MANPRLYDRIQPMRNPSMAPASPPPAPPLPTWVTFLARRKLAGPVLLFAVGYRPLAFVAGQVLQMADPVVGLLGIPAWERWSGTWAALLSHPSAPDRLAAALEAARSQAKDTL